MTTDQIIRHIRCKRQGKLFEIIAKRGCDMEDFVSRYMNSNFCLNCMDGYYSNFQVGAMNYILDELDDEFLDKVQMYPNNQIFDPAVCEWIGYIYRRLEIDKKVPSDKIYEAYPFSEMVACYPGYHTLSVPEVVEQMELA